LEGAEPTAQDDLYSLACVAYRILAGHRAYDGATAHAAETETLELKPIEHITQIEWRALRHAMALRRADRTTDVLSFLREFSTLPAVSALPVVGEPEDRPQTSPLVKFRRVAGLFATLLVIAAATAALRPEWQAQDYAAAEVTNSVVPAVSNITLPADIGPPLELRTSEASERRETLKAP
jgi:hypothetical protein